MIDEKTLPEHCISCNRWKKCKNPFFTLSGETPCDILEVWESPGFDSDATGTAAVGAMAQKLKSLYRKLGMHNLTIARTHALRCGGDKATKAELKHCRQYVLDDIKLAQPKVVLLLGANALASVLKLSNITQRHGDAIVEDGVTYVPIYSPGIIVKDERKELDVIRDLEHVRKIVAQAKGQQDIRSLLKKRYTIIENEQQLDEELAKMESCQTITVDTEFAPSLDWVLPGLYCLVLILSKGPKHGIILPIDHDESWAKGRADIKAKIKKFLGSRRFVFHNTEPDAIVLEQCFGIKLKDIKVAIDTMTASMALHGPDTTHALKSLAYLDTDIGGYEEELERWKAENNPQHYGEIPLRILGGTYAGGDGDAPSQLAVKYGPKIVSTGQKRFYHEILKNSYKLNIEMRRNGLMVDWDEWLWRAKYMVEEREVIYEKIKQIPVVKEYAQGIEAQKKKFSLRSPQQMHPLLFTILGLRPSGILTESGGDSINAKSLKYILLQSGVSQEAETVLRTILQAAKISTFNGMYIKQIANAMYFDGFLHAQFHNFTESARRGSRKPNVQNIPDSKPSYVGDTSKDPFNMRMLIRSRPGYTFISPDYCVHPDSRILTSEMRWVKAKDVSEGQVLVGFDECLGKQAKIKKSKVEKVKKLKKQCYEVKTSRGTVICSSDHFWVCRKENKTGEIRQWVETSSLKPGMAISYYARPWEELANHDSGYLAGFFDGEGYTSKGNVGFGQNDGPTLEKVLNLLKKYEFSYSEIKSSTEKCRRFFIQGERAGMRFLGAVRPERLLSKLSWEGKKTWSKHTKPAIVESITPVGIKEVIAIQTSTKTMIVEGMLSHNCQLEFRLAASYSNDKEMISGCMAGKGDDSHSRVAKKYNIPRTPCAKIVNFGIIYGGGWKKIQSEMYDKADQIWTEDFCKKVRYGMVDMYSDLFLTIDAYHDFVRHNGYVTTPILGHRRLLPHALTSPDKQIRARALREGWNHVVQAMGHDLLEMCMNTILNIIWERGLPWYICNDLHDGFLMEVPDEHIEDAARLCKQIMESVPKEVLGDWLRVPLVAEIKIGKYFGAMKELEI